MSEDATVDAAPPEAEWDGLFWPATPRRTDLSFDEIRSPFLMMVRHLPTPDTLMRASLAFGIGADPLLADWHGLWRQAVGDVAAFHAASPLATPPVDKAKADLSILMALNSPALAAAIVIAGENEKAPPEQRDETYHILEDALVVTSLARAGGAFALVIRPWADVPAVVTGDGHGALRLVPWKGTLDDQTCHASIVKRARTLFGTPNPYWESPAFRKASGRTMAVAEGPHHLSLMLRDMAVSGAGKAFLKSTASKRGTWVADLNGVTDATGAALAAHVAMGPAHGDLYHPRPDPRADILVQDFLPFTHEHRFLVIGHRIVASTASDRALSVLDRHRDRILYPGVARLIRPAGEAGAYDRGRADTVADRDLAARMARCARRTVRELRREGILPDCYCLDVGLTERGILPIEVNTVTHCGIYAANWDRVAVALGRRPAPAETRQAAGVTVTERDTVGDAVEFLLDLLADEPPMRLHEVARALVKAGEDAEAAVRAGREARKRREEEENRPPSRQDLAWIASFDLAPVAGPLPGGEVDQAAERADTKADGAEPPNDSNSDR